MCRFQRVIAAMSAAVRRSRGLTTSWVTFGHKGHALEFKIDRQFDRFARQRRPVRERDERSEAQAIGFASC